jgi:uncharacterized LabA/DUF88 family protein
LPDNKVALFIDFDNIRIGIRQHFTDSRRGQAELHPQKLMAKASKYGRVVTARAYADFTGHPKEFQDKLLHAAGIEPVHAPSKISGGRRQSSADLHMVIDMFLEAVDHEDIDTFVLMTGDADFLRVVATLRRRFGRRVVISGVQSTSTSLDLMNAGDVRDPITREDCDLTGELGRMSRPLVTRADLDATAAAEAAAPRPARGILSRLFGGKTAPVAEPVRSLPTPPPLAPPAPRRLRASELQRSSTPVPRTPSAGSRSGGGRGAAADAPSRAAAPPRGGRGQQAARELAAVGPESRPDEVEQKILKEVFMMPPGRMGITTMKTIEEVLRSKAGQMGATRKEIPMRLERLAGMGLFKRETVTRGNRPVETGELVRDHPVVVELTQGMERPEASPRVERAPRSPRGRRVLTPEDGPATETPPVPQAAPWDESPAAESEPVPEAASTFRWVSGIAGDAGEPAAAETEPVAKPKRAPRKAAPKATTAKPRTPRATKKSTTAKEAAPPAPAPEGEPPPE